MRGMTLGVAAAAVVAVSGGTAFAQGPWNKNVIRDSGNGANNRVVAVNRGGIPPVFAHPAYAHPGFGHPGFAPVGHGFFPGGPQFGGPFVDRPLLHMAGGIARNIIQDSGNGVDNTIIARNGGGFGWSPGGQFPFGPNGFGVNINVITNSGNGVGNVVKGVNRTFGSNGVNINVITNSGNGVGNVIKGINR
jgi:hypothetical protein